MGISCFAGYLVSVNYTVGGFRRITNTGAFYFGNPRVHRSRRRLFSQIHSIKGQTLTHYAF